MQNDSEKNYYLEWFKKAQEDELSIRAILKEGGAFSTVCFLSQQMVEKYLKGLLVFYKSPFSKIHDLLQLETLLLIKVPKIRNLHNDLKLLNTYYIETRYPGDYPEFSGIDAKQAFSAAKKIKDFIINIIK